MPTLDADFEVDIYTLELPFKTTEYSIPIVTLKQKLTLEYSVKERRVRVNSESLKTDMDLPNAENRLKDRPDFNWKVGDIEYFFPDYLALKNYENLDAIPITIIVNKIKGTVDWR